MPSGVGREHDRDARGSEHGNGGLIERLRRRKLFQWGIAYLAGAWLLLQVLDFFRENFAWSPTLVRIITVLVGVGFLVALVLAWYHGERGRQRLGGVEIMILAGLLAIAGFAVTLVPRADSGTIVVDSVMAPDDGTLPIVRGADPSVTVAIVPFDNRSPSENDAHVAEGLTTEIASQLSKVADIRLISRSAVEIALASGASPIETGRDLGAGRLLGGVVQVAGDRVRITAHLTDVQTLEEVWGETYDREILDLFDLQSEVALAIVTGLEAELTPAEQARISDSATENLAAFRLFERQRGLLGNRLEENRLGIELLKEAIALDSTYVDAYARLGWRYVWEVRLGRGEMLDSAWRYAERAVALDPESAAAHFARASAATADSRGGIALAFRRALELDPSNESVLHDLSFFLTLTGELVEATEYAVRAVKIAPNQAISWWHLAIPLLRLGSDDRTRRVLERALTEASDDGGAMMRAELTLMRLDLLRGDAPAVIEQARGALFRYAGQREPELRATETLLFVRDADTAWPVLARHLERSVDFFPGANSSVGLQAGYALWLRGDRARAEARFESLLSGAETYLASGGELPRAALEIAAVHAIRGEREPALEWLAQAYDMGLRDYRALALDPMFDPVRSDPAFGRLLDRMSADVERMAASVEALGIGPRVDDLLADGS